MATDKTLKRLETLIWVLIYGGLFGVVIGIAIADAAPLAGRVMAWVGGGVAAVGAALVWVRARIGSP